MSAWLEWVLRWFAKKDEVSKPITIEPPIVEGSSPRTSELVPSPSWVKDELPTYFTDKGLNKPTYEITDLIEHLEFRMQIHETYWGLVENDPAWSSFGSVEYQQWAIEGYSNCIYYLKLLGDLNARNK